MSKNLLNEKFADIDNADITNIEVLSVMDSLTLQNIYFPEIVKYALMHNRTYEEPIMTQIFDEHKIDSNTIKGILKSMYSDETQVFLFYRTNEAFKTTWGILSKYWDEFFYSPEEAVIYVNEDNIYYNAGMELIKINNLESMSEESIFDCCEKFNDSNTHQARAFLGLFGRIPSDLHDVLYMFFNRTSEVLKILNNNEIRNNYMHYCNELFRTISTSVYFVSKSYNKDTLQNKDGFLDDTYAKSNIEKIYKMLRNIS